MLMERERGGREGGREEEEEEERDRETERDRERDKRGREREIEEDHVVVYECTTLQHTCTLYTCMVRYVYTMHVVNKGPQNLIVRKERRLDWSGMYM